MFKNINRKKLKKNLPYAFVFAALIAVVGLRVVYQQHRYDTLNSAAAIELTEEQKARISFVAIYEDPAKIPDKATDGAYVLAGSFKTAEDGSIAFTPTTGIPDASYSKQTVSLIFDFDVLPPDPKKIESAVAATIKEWRRHDFKAYSLVVRYINPTVDIAALDNITAFLHQYFKSPVGAYLQPKWFDEDKGKAPTLIANIGKNTQSFIYDEKDIRDAGESLGLAIRKMDARKVAFMVLVDEKPDLLELRKTIQDTSNFGGLIVRNLK